MIISTPTKPVTIVRNSLIDNFSSYMRKANIAVKKVVVIMIDTDTDTGMRYIDIIVEMKEPYPKKDRHSTDDFASGDRSLKSFMPNQEWSCP